MRFQRFRVVLGVWLLAAASCDENEVVDDDGVVGSPVADAGVDVDAAVGERVRLDATGSYDPDGDALTFSWSISVAPSASAAEIESPDAAVTAFVPDIEGDYDIELTVSNGELDSIDLMRISVFVPDGTGGGETGGEDSGTAGDDGEDTDTGSDTGSGSSCSPVDAVPRSVGFTGACDEDSDCASQNCCEPGEEGPGCNGDSNDCSCRRVLSPGDCEGAVVGGGAPEDVCVEDSDCAAEVCETDACQCQPDGSA